MYSLVLATMLTTSPTAPAHGWGGGCHGCYGSCGYSTCHGCYASCYGCYGGWGSGYGYGGYTYGGCCGGWNYGCSGYCYGCGGYSYGGCCGSYMPSGYSSGYCYGGCCGGYMVVPGGAQAPMNKVGGSGETTATVVIKVPVDAKLTVNGQETVVPNGEQRFKTPTLEPGRTYSYDMTATVKRDGKDVTVTRKVLVKAGEESRADFSDLGVAATNQKPRDNGVADGR
jgi:uncharacterized protein (TIGR03000 family)